MGLCNRYDQIGLDQIRAVLDSAPIGHQGVLGEISARAVTSDEDGPRHAARCHAHEDHDPDRRPHARHCTIAPLCATYSPSIKALPARGRSSSTSVRPSSAWPRRSIHRVYSKPGWVEHDPELLWQTQVRTARRVLAEHGVCGREIAAIGISNQRETTLLWEREGGRPLAKAIVWQARRTAPYCERLRGRG